MTPAEPPFRPLTLIWIISASCIPIKLLDQFKLLIISTNSRRTWKDMDVQVCDLDTLPVPPIAVGCLADKEQNMDSAHTDRSSVCSARPDSPGGMSANGT